MQRESDGNRSREFVQCQKLFITTWGSLHPETTIVVLEHIFMTNTIETNRIAIESLRSQKIIAGQVLSYRSLSTAESVPFEHSVKPTRIILGDHPWFWVVSPADAERLMNAGYDLAN
jgi:hypothetical protein